MHLARLHDITVMTTLIELACWRVKELLDEVTKRLDEERIWPSAEFFNAKIEEQSTRHEKFGLTGYSLEPNVKSSPGATTFRS